MVSGVCPPGTASRDLERPRAVCRGSVRPWALGAGAVVIPFLRVRRSGARLQPAIASPGLRATGAKRGCSAVLSAGFRGF